MDDVLRGVGETLDKANNAARRMRRLRQKDRQNGVEDLRRNVGEQANERQKESVASECRVVLEAMANPRNCCTYRYRALPLEGFVP